MPGSTLLQPLHRLRGRTAAALDSASAWLDERPGLLYAVLFVIYMLFALRSIAGRPMWFDELFTFHIAQAPTLGQMFAQLRALDLNPPLTYLLTRASMHLLGANALGARTPETLAFFAAMVFLGRLVARRFGNLYGFAASTLLLASPTGDLFTEARPYAVMVAALALGWWMTEAAAEQPAPWRLALVFLAGCAALLSQALAVPAWLLLIAVILLFREWRRPALVAAAALPLLVTPLLRGFIAEHGHTIFPPSFLPTPTMVFAFYNARFVREEILLVLTAIVLLSTAGFAALRGSSGWGLRRPEWAVALLWTALPGMLMLWFMVTRAAFFYRYGSAASLGVAVIAIALLARWTSGRRSAALIVAVLALLESHALPGALLQLRHLRRVQPVPLACVPCQLAAQMHLPLVDANGLTYVEMAQRESSATLANTFYLQDLDAAHSLAHASIFDHLDRVQQTFNLADRVVDANQFVQTHRRFLVYGSYSYPEQWLLRKLKQDGARLQLVNESIGSYADQDTWLVELP
ncbi:glycosyltransferase family 39 protein [Terriglobus sp.]|uniref:glycosyltransferase family 39 protein n=1 Tax=Terriglobus sp. TaxID=1889013 RepID=UPI003B007EB9